MKPLIGIWLYHNIQLLQLKKETETKRFGLFFLRLQEPSVFRSPLLFRTAKIRKKHEKTKAQSKKMQVEVNFFFAKKVSCGLVMSSKMTIFAVRKQ